MPYTPECQSLVCNWHGGGKESVGTRHSEKGGISFCDKKKDPETDRINPLKSSFVQSIDREKSPVN